MAYKRAILGPILRPRSPIPFTSHTIPNPALIKAFTDSYRLGGPRSWTHCPLGQVDMQPYLHWVLNRTVEGIYDVSPDIRCRIRYVFVKCDYPEENVPEWSAVDMLNNFTFTYLQWKDALTRINYLIQKGTLRRHVLETYVEQYGTERTKEKMKMLLCTNKQP
jgi:hypothetical protein